MSAAKRARERRWVVACWNAAGTQVHRRYDTETEARAEMAALAAECAPAWLFYAGSGNVWITEGANYDLMPASGEAGS